MDRTKEMAAQLREAEEVMGVLDQHANPTGTALGRAYLRMFDEVVRLRSAELREWNEDGPTLYRCQGATWPYHTPADGPCEVYTPNVETSAGEAIVLCDTCADRLLKGVATR